MRKRPEAAPCSRRIFEGVIDGRLIALDARNGAVCTGFGNSGSIDLNALANFGVGQVSMSSPPVIFENLVIVGSAIGDNVRNDMPHGIVRAFDARTGAQAWAWDPIPAAVGDKTGAGNTWAPISVDVARGLVMLPTSSPSPDYWGGDRTAEMPYTTSVVTLNARTGERVWHFQTIRHNLWDYDLASQPALVTILRDGAARDAVVQATKMGFVFVLDRDTGAPLFPVTERAPRSHVRGEVSAPTQPVPSLPRPIARQAIKAEDAWGLMYFDAKACERELAGLDNEGLYTPPSERGAVVFPLFGGGSNWGSVAYDPSRNLLVANTMNLVGMAQVVPRAQFDAVAKANPDDQATPQRGTPFGMRRKILMSFLGSRAIRRHGASSRRSTLRPARFAGACRSGRSRRDRSTRSSTGVRRTSAGRSSPPAAWSSSPPRWTRRSARSISPPATSCGKRGCPRSEWRRR